MTREETDPDWTQHVPCRFLRFLRTQDTNALRAEAANSSWAEVLRLPVLGRRIRVAVDDLSGRHARMPPQCPEQISRQSRRRLQQAQRVLAEDPWQLGQPRNCGDPRLSS